MRNVGNQCLALLLLLSVQQWSALWNKTSELLLGLCGQVLVARGCRGGFCEKLPEAPPVSIRAAAGQSWVHEQWRWNLWDPFRIWPLAAWTLSLYSPRPPVLGAFLHCFVLHLFNFILGFDFVRFLHGQNLLPSCVSASFYSPFKYQLFTQ